MEITNAKLSEYKNILVGIQGCTFCEDAKKLLKSKNVDYKYFDRSECEDLVEEVKVKKNYAKFPLIFLDGMFIKGYDDLVKHYQ